MPENFTVFNARNRDANVQYNSGAYTVPADTIDKMVRFTITNLDIINEPDTTIIYWQIDRNDGGGWVHMVGGSFSGLNGEIPPKSPGRLATNIDGILGQDVRGSIYFESLNDQRKRFGISGETYS